MAIKSLIKPAVTKRKRKETEKLDKVTHTQLTPTKTRNKHVKPPITESETEKLIQKRKSIARLIMRISKSIYTSAFAMEGIRTEEYYRTAYNEIIEDTKELVKIVEKNKSI